MNEINAMKEQVEIININNSIIQNKNDLDENNNSIVENNERSQVISRTAIGNTKTNTKTELKEALNKKEESKNDIDIIHVVSET